MHHKLLSVPLPLSPSLWSSVLLAPQLGPSFGEIRCDLWHPITAGPRLLLRRAGRWTLASVFRVWVYGDFGGSLNKVVLVLCFDVQMVYERVLDSCCDIFML